MEQCVRWNVSQRLDEISDSEESSSIVELVREIAVQECSIADEQTVVAVSRMEVREVKDTDEDENVADDKLVTAHEPFTALEVKILN